MEMTAVPTLTAVEIAASILAVSISSLPFALLDKPILAWIYCVIEPDCRIGHRGRRARQKQGLPGQYTGEEAERNAGAVFSELAPARLVVREDRYFVEFRHNGGHGKDRGHCDHDADREGDR